MRLEEDDDQYDRPGSPERESIVLEGHEFRSMTDRRKYGNMAVLYDGQCLITLGPDYWCFLPTFIIFCVISYLIIALVFHHSTSFYFQMATLIICGGMCVSYLAVAISNPGIVLEEDLADTEEQEENPMSRENLQRKRLCRKCNIRVKKGTYHCRDCDVCIEGYDHHCPWTSKCIGRGNLIRFYIFLGFVPLYLIYIFVAFATVMSTLALENARVHVRHG